jgi:hypothetical protein
MTVSIQTTLSTLELVNLEFSDAFNPKFLFSFDIAHLFLKSH